MIINTFTTLFSNTVFTYWSYKLKHTLSPSTINITSCNILYLVVGAQLLILTSAPDTNGSYCPGRVTFTCNGTSVANGLEWIITETLHNTFILNPGDTNFPRTVSDVNNITIRIIRASPVENSIGIDIVSTLSVECLNPILNDYISCRTLFGSSSLFLVLAKGNNDVFMRYYNIITM